MGADSFYAGIPQAELDLHRLMIDVLESSPAPSATIHQAATSDAVLLLGEDVWNTAPVLALAIRQASLNRPIADAMRTKRLSRWDDSAVRSAIQGQKGPLFIASPAPSELDSVSVQVRRCSPTEAARLGFAVAHEIDPASPAPAGVTEEIRQLAARIAVALIHADHPLVVSGSGMGEASLIHAAANVARALKRVGREATLSLVFPEAGSFGLAVLAETGIEGAARSLDAGETAIVAAEVDLLRSAPGGDWLLKRAAHLVVLDHTRTETVDRAEVVLPTTPYAEGSGSYVSSEGRAQRFFSVYPPREPVSEAWRWLGKLSAMRGRQSRPWETLDEVLTACAGSVPRLRGIVSAAPGAGFREGGQRIARQPHRLTGRTAVVANVELHEPAPPDGSRFPAGLLYGRKAGVPFPGPHPTVLVAPVELRPVPQQVPDRSRRPASRRRRRSAAVRAARPGAGRIP